MRIELLDSIGEIATRQDIPDAEEPPTVILWGERIFTYTNTADTYPRANVSPVHVYREATIHKIIG